MRSGEKHSVNVNFKHARNMGRNALISEIVYLQNKMQELDAIVEEYGQYNSDGIYTPIGMKYKNLRYWYGQQLRIYKKVAGVSGNLVPARMGRKTGEEGHNANSF